MPCPVGPGPPLHTGVTSPLPLPSQGGGGVSSPSKKRPLRPENDFVRFDTPFLPKPLFFRKAKSSTAVASAPHAMQVRELSLPTAAQPTAAWEPHTRARGAGPRGPLLSVEPRSAVLGVPRAGVTRARLGNLGWPEGLAAGIAGAVGEASSLNA